MAKPVLGIMERRDDFGVLLVKNGDEWPRRAAIRPCPGWQSRHDPCEPRARPDRPQGRAASGGKGDEQVAGIIGRQPVGQAGQIAGKNFSLTASRAVDPVPQYPITEGFET